MAKFKVSNKGNLITITHKQFKKFEISERELDAFEKHLIPGFFRPKMVKQNRFEYVAPFGVSLDSYFKENLSVHKLYSVLAQIIEITKRVDMYHLYLQNLVLDKTLIYVKQTTGEVFFLYLPLVKNPNASAAPNTFVIDLLSAIKTDSEEVKAEIAKILEYLNSPEVYRVEDIEKMISMFYPQIYQQITRAETGKSGYITSSKLSYEKHYGVDLNKPSADSVQLPPSMEFEEGTTLLVEEEEGTTLLCEEEGTTLLQESGPVGCLTRIRTGEEIRIFSSYFRIGKGTDVDYCIEGNTAISRHHVSIRNIGNEFYLIDENSKNHTWVNGKLADPGVEELLADGAQVRMADEEFVYTVE